MEMTDELRQLNDFVRILLFERSILTKTAYGILCCLCLVLISAALYKHIRRQWDSRFYIPLCAAVLIYSLCSLLSLFGGITDKTETLYRISSIGMLFIPALLMLHVRVQISYDELKIKSVLYAFTIPVFLFAIILRELFFPPFSNDIYGILPGINETQWYLLCFYLYYGIALIKAYLLCFNVFYQMPPRTRRSTKFTIVSITSIAGLLISDLIWQNRLRYMIPQYEALEILLPLAAPAALAALIYPLYDALHIMPASDVIVTSREFVMKGLHTTILVLNRRMQILDWNKNDWDGKFSLPKPLYKEPYAIYRKRILEQGHWRVSRHDEDIIIKINEDKETQFLLRLYDACHGKRKFGSVAEITEVTPIYNILRYFEDIAHFDSLTGLHNRNAYNDYINRMVTEENLPFAIIVGDLNKLKQINDVYGHLLGDELIKKAAEIITRTAPHEAFVARLGGDEFVVLVPGGSVKSAEFFIDKCGALCRETKHEIYNSPGISWGFSIMTSMEQSFSDMFTKADEMMYAYKKATKAREKAQGIEGYVDDRL